MALASPYIQFADVGAVASALHRPMIPRVCVISPLYHPNLGGVGRQAQLLTERLRKEGVELFVISRMMRGMPPASFSPDVEVIRVPCLFSKTIIVEEIGIKNILLSISYSLGFIAALIRYRHRYDLVHFHGASIPLWLALPFLKVMGKRVVAKVAAANAGTEPGSLSGKYWFVGNFLTRLVKKVDAFIATTDEIREGLVRDGIPLERIHRIPNFVDPDAFRAPEAGEKERLKAQFGYSGKTMVLFAGRLVPCKGVEHLLEAWCHVAEAFPDAVLNILGDGPLSEWLQEMASRLGVSGSVRFTGRVDNVPDYLRAADAFVLSSLREGMPNSLLEALAAGLPVVSSRIGGTIEIIQDGKNGLLFDPGDGLGLARCLKTILSSEALRERLSASALATIKNSFGLESRLNKYFALYNGLSASK